MNFLDISTVALIAAAIGFYLQLMAAYRKKVREFEVDQSRFANHKKAKKNPLTKPVFGSFSKKPLDWVIGGVGYLMMMFGILVYVSWLKIPSIQTAWWAPTAAGIILFSWFFH
jgi:hypothetical protein